MGDLFKDPFSFKSAAGITLFERLSGAEGIKVEAESRQNIANFNAAIQKREAEARRQRATFAQKRQARKGAQIKSTLTAELGAAGGIGTLVAADLAAEQAEELELENLLIGFEGEVAAERALSQAELDILSGKIAKQKGRSEALAANIRLGTTLLTGFA